MNNWKLQPNPTVIHVSELPHAHITAHSVVLDGTPIPWPIEDESITVTPGGHKGVNRITLTFLVGNVNMDDPSA